MPRPLDDFQTPVESQVERQRDLGVARRTSRSFAAAVAVLLLATLVANRTSTALTKSPTNAAAAVAAGTVELGDDDAGRSLFDLDALSPTQPVVRCVEVEYTGTILPVDLRMRTEATGALGDFLDVTVESGTGGGFESCDGFEPDSALFDGTLTELTDADWFEVGVLLNRGDGRTFRITLQVQDDAAALGQATSLEVAWEATPA